MSVRFPLSLRSVRPHAATACVAAMLPHRRPQTKHCAWRALWTERLHPRRLSHALRGSERCVTDKGSVSKHASSDPNDTPNALAIAIALARQRFVLRPRSRSATVLRCSPARSASVIWVMPACRRARLRQAATLGAVSTPAAEACSFGFERIMPPVSCFYYVLSSQKSRDAPEDASIVRC